MSHAAITFLVLAVVVVLFVTTRIPVEIVAIGGALSLYATGVIDLEKTFGGFGDPTIIFIASLFIVSEALDAAGVSTWAGQALIARAGESRARLATYVMLAAAGLSALVTINGAVAALLPAVVVMAIRYQAPSRLLLPLAFAAHAGSLLTLTGSPVNVIIAQAIAADGQRAPSYFEFGLVGAPLVAGTIAIISLFGKRLLPRRHARTMTVDFSDHARLLMKQYALSDELFRLQFTADSPNVGELSPGLDLAKHRGITIVGFQTKKPHDGHGHGAIESGDVVIVRGEREDVTQVATEQRLTMTAVAPSDPDAVLTRERGVAEVVIPPRSDMIGAVVFPGMVTSGGDLVILAVQRKGVDVTKETTLSPGDTLLLRGRWDALGRRLPRDPDVLIVDSPELVRRRAAPLGARARASSVILLAMVLLLATRAMPPAVVALIAACAMVLRRVLTVEQAYRGIAWSAVILVGAMIPMSTAMHDSGAAQLIAEGIVRLVHGFGPYGLLGGLFLLTAALGQ
ncbi:MAG TPA: SLC13 family permease, partial [Gemmatimonadaceae bacterium]|nr:SLC13 family permease [Gemmatimonadaceae bacterium]